MRTRRTRAEHTLPSALCCSLAPTRYLAVARALAPTPRRYHHHTHGLKTEIPLSPHARATLSSFWTDSAVLPRGSRERERERGDSPTRYLASSPFAVPKERERKSFYPPAAMCLYVCVCAPSPRRLLNSFSSLCRSPAPPTRARSHTESGFSLNSFQDSPPPPFFSAGPFSKFSCLLRGGFARYINGCIYGHLFALRSFYPAVASFPAE